MEVGRVAIENRGSEGRRRWRWIKVQRWRYRRVLLRFLLPAQMSSTGGLLSDPGCSCIGARASSDWLSRGGGGDVEGEEIFPGYRPETQGHRGETFRSSAEANRESTHTCVRTYLHTVHAYIHTWTCMHAYIHTHIHTRLQTHIQTNIHAHTHTHTYTLAHTHVHTQTQTHVYTHTHAHTQAYTHT